MSFQSNQISLGDHVAGEDLSGYQFCFVKMGSTGWVHSTDGDSADGILQNKPGLGQAATVCVFGESKLRASAAVTRGAAIASTSTGQGVTATLGSQNVVAKAMEAATAAGVLFAVLLQQTGLHVAD